MAQLATASYIHLEHKAIQAQTDIHHQKCHCGKPIVLNIA